MPGGFPKTGLHDESGKPVLSTDERFAHPWMSSRSLFFFDNETCDDVFKCSIIPGDPANPSADASFWPSKMTLGPSFPVLPL